MKIHLPVGLRKALLACLAAITMPATLSATLGTASGVAAAYVALSALTAQQTAAAEVTVHDHAEWDTFVQNGDQNKAGEKVIIDQTSTVAADSIYFRNADDTVYADIQFDTDLFINNGYSNNSDGRTYTFNGAFTGDGNFTLGGGSIENQHYVCTGDLSQWGGDILITGGGGSATVTLTGGGFKSSTGTITVTAHNNSKLIVDGVELKNSEITASLLEIKNNVTFTGQSVTVTGATTIAENATLTLGESTQMHLGSLAEGSTLTSLTLGAGSEFALDAGSLNIGTLTLSGQGASLAMTIADASTQLTLESLVAGENILTIHLDGLTEDLLGETGFALFGAEGWKMDWAGKIFVEGDINGRRVELNAQGMVVLSNGYNITGQDTLDAAQTGDNKQECNQAGVVWYIDMAEGYFTGDDTGNAAIKADVTLLQTFRIKNGHSDASVLKSVIFDGALSAAEDVDLIYAWTGTHGDVAYVFNGDLSNFNGDMKLEAATHGVTFSFGSTTGNGAITDEGSTGNGKLKVALNGTTVNATVHANDLSIAGNVTLNKNVTITGTSTLNESATLALGEGAQVSLGTVTGSLTSLTLAEGSSLSVGSGDLTAGTLAVNGAAVLGVGADGVLSFGSVTGTGSLTIDLSALGGFTTYQLFAAENVSWLADWLSKITFTGAAGSVTLGEDGVITRALSDTKYGDPLQYSDDSVTVSSETGAKWYSGVAAGQTYNVETGGDLKLSNSAEGNPTLNLSGAINSLYFASDGDGNGGTFRFGGNGAGTWTMNDGASIKDIYVDNAELWFDQVTVDLGEANVHLNGRTDGDAFSGALRGRNQAQITIGGNLDVMGDTLISLQSGSNVIVNGELTGAGELMLGVYSDVGQGAVKLHKGGTLDGQLTFWGNGGAHATLVLGDAAAAASQIRADDRTTLTVGGLSSKTDAAGEGGAILAEGDATLELVGTGEYTYNGTIGTETPPDDPTTGWSTEKSGLDFIVNLGEASSTQNITGNVHVRNLTISGGKLVVPSNTSMTMQIDGNMTITGTGTFSLGVSGNVQSHVIINGDFTIENLDNSSREAFFSEGQATTLIKGQFRADGSITTYGALTLEKGGELSGTLRCGWGAAITLGADLTVGDFTKLNSQSTSISRCDGTEGTVYLLQSITGTKEQSLSEFYNNLSEWHTVNEGVGFGKAGDGTLTLNGTGNITHDFKVAAGTLILHNTDSASAVVFEKSLIGDGNVELDAYDQGGSKTVQYEIRGELSIGGILTVFGGNNTESSTVVKLTQGGRVGSLKAAWGAEIKLGADLTVGDLLADNNNRNAKFTKADETEGAVNLVFEVAQGDKTTSLSGYTFSGVGFEKSGAGTLSIGDANIGTDVTVSGGTLALTGASTTFSNSLTVEGEGSKVTAAELHTHTLAVNGGNVTVTGKLGLNDQNYTSEMSITGGGSVEAGFLRGQEDGHAGCLIVGAADSTGTLTLTGTSKPSDGKTLKAKSLKVQSGATGEDEGSKVTITGDVELYNHLGGDEQNALEIDGNSSVDITGSLYGQEKGNMKGIHITTGSSLTVSGSVTMVGSAFNINAGTAEIGGTLSAGDVTVEGEGSALTVKGATATLGTLAGNGSVSGANITVTGSTEKVFSGRLESGTKVTLSANGYWTLGEGFSGEGSTVVVSGTLGIGSASPAPESAAAEALPVVNVDNLEITPTGSVNINSGFDMHVTALTLSKGDDDATGGVVSVAGGSTLTIGSVPEASAGKLTSLTLGGGSSLVLGSGTLSMGTLSVTGADATITLNVGGEGTPKLSIDSATTSEMGNLTIELDGLTKDIVGAEGYVVLESTNGDLLQALLGRVEFEGKESGLFDVEVKDNSLIVTYMANTELTWTPKSGTIELAWDTTSNGWDQQDAIFKNGNSVRFIPDSGVADATVNVAAGITSGNVTFDALDSGNTTWTLNLAGDFSVNEECAIKVGKGNNVTMQAGAEAKGASVTLRSMELGEGAEFHVGGGDTNIASLTLAGSISRAEGASTNPTVTLVADSITWSDTLTIDGVSVTLGTSGEGQTSGSITGGSVNLANGATLALGSDMVFSGKITGAASSVKAADEASVYALWDAGSANGVTWDEFEGHFGNALDAGVGYGVSMSDANLSISDAATLGHNFKVAGTGKTLTFTGALDMGVHTVEVAEGATLALGGGGSGSGSLTGGGGVKFTGGDFSFTGRIGIRSIEVSGGNLSLTDGVSFTGSEQTILVSDEGKLTLGMTNAEAMNSVSVRLAGTSAETENLHLDASATLGKLWGIGKVTMKDSGCSLTIVGTAGENEVFTGQIAPMGAGETEVTGVFRLGNGALIGNTTTVTGALNVQGGSSATVNTLHVGSTGTVDIAGGATLTVGTELAGDGDAYGSISGAGTLKVTCDGTYDGAISVTNLTYAGNANTLELSGAVTSENIRVESGTLRVSGGDTLASVTLVGGTLDASKDGLSIASLAIEGAAGLKVSQNLTLASVTGSAALSSLEIGAGANLTITTGNLALNGTLSWGSGAVLTLGDDSEQKIIFGEGFSFGEGNGEEKLTVHLSDTYLKGLTNHEDSFVELNGLTWDSSWKDKFEFETDAGSKYHDLGMEDDGDLYWERDGVKWDGGSDGTWSDTGDQGWNEVEGDDPAKQEPSKQDVYFKEDSDAPSDVKIDSAGVNPANVYVESGDYTFTGGGLNIAGDGVLAVGGTKDMARLALKNANTSIPAIELQKNGTLALEAEGAVPENTKIKFMGGTLEIGQVGTDVSKQVAQLEEGSTDIAKVKVGEGQNATWGDGNTNVADNGGLTLILDEKGLEKTGAGNFTLAWKETTDAKAHVGALTVTEGTLTLDVNTDAGDVVMSGVIGGDGTLKVSGGNITLSGANTVKHIELAGGNTTLGNGNVLGNEQTELTLSGGNITSSGAGNTVSAGVVQVTEGTTSTVIGTVTFNGDVTGNGTLAAASNATVTLAGSVNGFSGTLDIGKSGTITLSGAEGEVGASAAGNGTLEVKSGTGVTLTGQLGSGGALTVQNSGSGKLVIAGNVAAGTSWSFGSAGNVGNIVFGDAGHAVNLTGASSVTGKGTVVLANVTLKDFEKGEAKLVVDTAFPTSVARTVSTETTGQGGIVDVGGMAAGNLDGITVNAGGLLKGVSGVYTVSKDKAPLTLHFTETNWGNEGEGKALIEGATGDFRIDLSSGDAVNQGLQLGFKADVIEWFRTHDELYLRVLGSGTWKTDGVSIDWTKMTDTTAQILNLVVGQNYQFTADGLKLTGSTKDMYLVTGEEYGDSPNSSSPDDFSGKLATVVTNEQTLTLKWAEKGTVNNLLGTEGTQLVIQDVGGKGITVTLDNTYHDPLRDDRYPENTEAKGQDTTFAGSITGGDGVDIVKSGLGKLTVGGNYTLEDGDTRIEAGALELGGDVNEMGSLTFAYRDAPAEDEDRGLLLGNGQTTIGRIEEAADAASTEGNEVNVANGAGLNLTGQSTLAHTGITGDGSGTLKLADGAGLTFTGTEGIKGVAVNLEGERSTLDLGATQSELTNLTGKGTLKSTAGGNVSVGGGIFSGTLDGTGGGTLTVADNASVTLDNVKGTDMNVQLQGKGSTLIVKVDGKKGDGTDTLKFGDVHIGDGHLTLDYGKKSLTQNFVQGKIGRIGEGMIEFHSDGPVANGDVYTGFSVNPDGNWNDFIDRHVKFTGLGNFMKEHEARVDEAGNLMLKTKDAVENKFEREIPGAGKNAHAGARMLWESLRDLSPTDAFFELMSNPTSDYAHLVYTLVSAIDNGQTTGLERTLTSVAGASISTLTPALAQDIHRQLTTIRNRTTGMSAEVPTDGYDEFPFWHAWIQAEGGYHKMDADGMEPGFTLHNWGGTVGVDADTSRATTMGLAVTAMYGDLKPDAADSATGDLDTVYLSAFARTMHGAWSHTFVLSGGIAEAKLDRTVSYNGGNYRTRGDTDGYVVGALYEVGYTRLANKEGTVALQPIANVELRHTSLRGYTEKGSDAGVDVDDMDMTVLTLGAGARVQAAVGENAFNRSTVLEARLLAKADIGDRSGTATNAIVGHSKRAEVESAEVGAVGIETGIGISVPLGSHSGSIFADASLEWRDNWVSTNATLGYRINF